MNLIDKIKQTLRESSEKLGALAEKLVEKGKQAGSEGLEITQKALSTVGERASEVASLTRVKIELNTLRRELERAYEDLGERVYAVYREQGNREADSLIAELLTRIAHLEQQFHDKEQEHEALRRELSEDYVVNKLSEDLAEADGTIEQVTVAENSNVVGKRLKEIVLPKQALISTVKREKELIIPDGNTRLEAGDRVVILGKREDVEKVVRRLSSK
ncbi:MAG: hypothetical protein D6681_00250 [Calditrichaeota bacterium]|nr:MAG: hypothetical protein D6681_00250 [Calditrichota bacterium]